jgi:hypothetical protein
MTRVTKSYLQLAAIVLAVAAFIVIYFFVPGRLSFSSLVVDGETFDGLRSGRSQVGEPLSVIRFNDEELFFDVENGFCLYSLVGKSRKAYNPGVKLEGGSSDCQIAFLENGISDELIASAGDIPFIMYDDSSYYEGRLECTTLPIMSISTEDDIPDNKEPVSMFMQLYDNELGAANRLVTSDGDIHTRGATSMADPKKNFRISLTTESVGGSKRDNDLGLLGLRKDEDWILYSCFNDPEKVREVFSARLWKNTVGSDNFGKIDTGYEYKYLELFINGEYYGLYALGYPLQPSQMGIAINNNEKVLTRKRGYETGLMYVSDEGVNGTYPPQGKSVPEANELVRDYFIRFDEVVDDPEAIKELMDMDNCLDFFLFFNLIQAHDNVVKNQCLYIERQGDGFKTLYIPWDMDLTWGIDVGRNLYGFSPDYNFEYKWDAMYRLMQIDTDNMTALLQKKYKELRRNAWSDKKILSMLDSLEKDVYDSGAFRRDNRKWFPDGGADPDARLSNFRQYVAERFKAVDKYVEEFTVDDTPFYKPLSFALGDAGYMATSLCDWEGKILILEIENPGIWNDEIYYDRIKGFGVPDEYISPETTFRNALVKSTGSTEFESISDETDMIMAIDSSEVIPVQGFFRNAASGKFVSTSIGDLSYFETEGGIRAMYFNGEEIYAEENAEPEYDMRLIRIDAESLEVEEIIYYTF